MKRIKAKKITEISDELFGNSPIAMLIQDYSKIRKYFNRHKFKSGEDIMTYLDNHPITVHKLAGMVKLYNVNKSLLRLFKANSIAAFNRVHKKMFGRESYEVFKEELVAIALGKNSFESSVNLFSMEGKRHYVSMLWKTVGNKRISYDKVIVYLIDTTMQRTMSEMIYVKNYAIESSISGICITSPLGEIVYVNDSFMSLWGIDAGSKISGDKIEKFLLHPIGAQKILHRIHISGWWRGEIMPRMADTEKILLVYGSIVYDEFNTIVGLVFSFQDITEFKKLDMLRLEFTNIAAHELITPIVPIMSLLNLMQETPKDYGLTQVGQKYVDICLHNMDRLNHLVSDILDISKLESRAMKFNLENYDFLLLLNDVIASIKPVAIQKKIQLKTKFPGKMPIVYGDKGKIYQVISNLLNNAIKFTDKGYVFLHAEIRELEIKIKIIDTGIGIKNDDIPKLFTKFFQAQDITTRKTKGSGLGLAICKEIIDAHGGNIWSRSQGLGLGSTFGFSIPIKTKLIEKPTYIKDKTVFPDDMLL